MLFLHIAFQLFSHFLRNQNSRQALGHVAQEGAKAVLRAYRDHHDGRGFDGAPHHG